MNQHFISQKTQVITQIELLNNQLHADTKRCNDLSQQRNDLMTEQESEKRLLATPNEDVNFEKIATLAAQIDALNEAISVIDARIDATQTELKQRSSQAARFDHLNRLAPLASQASLEQRALINAVSDLCQAIDSGLAGILETFDDLSEVRNKFYGESTPLLAGSLKSRGEENNRACNWLLSQLSGAGIDCSGVTQPWPGMDNGTNVFTHDHPLSFTPHIFRNLVLTQIALRLNERIEKPKPLGGGGVGSDVGDFDNVLISRKSAGAGGSTIGNFHNPLADSTGDAQ